MTKFFFLESSNFHAISSVKLLTAVVLTINPNYDLADLWLMGSFNTGETYLYIFSFFGFSVRILKVSGTTELQKRLCL